MTAARRKIMIPVLLGTIVATTLGGRALFLAVKPAQHPLTRQEGSGVAELRQQVAQLAQRLRSAESTTVDLTNAVARARQAQSVVETAAPAPSQETPSAAPAPPTLQQQMARFEKHFSNLDERRGKAEDAELEAKFNTALIDTPAELEILKKASVDRVVCGNQLCRVEVTFADVATARLGQGQLQAQLGRLASSFTAYMEPESKHLQAYFATGSAQLPEFPPAEASLSATD